MCSPQPRADCYRLQKASPFPDALCHAPEPVRYGCVWASLPLPLPAVATLPHGSPPESAPSIITYTRISVSGSAPGKPCRTSTSNERTDVKASNHTYRWLCSGGALGWKPMELTRGALGSPLPISPCSRYLGTSFCARMLMILFTKYIHIQGLISLFK